jgi:hypothetical protein
MGQKDAFAYELELQPVYPVHLGSWNLINRLIVPVTYRERSSGICVFPLTGMWKPRKTHPTGMPSFR